MHDGRLQTQSAYNGFLLQDGTRVYPPIGKDQRATHTHTASKQKVMQVMGMRRWRWYEKRERGGWCYWHAISKVNARCVAKLSMYLMMICCMVLLAYLLLN